MSAPPSTYLTVYVPSCRVSNRCDMCEIYVVSSMLIAKNVLCTINDVRRVYELVLCYDCFPVTKSESTGNTTREAIQNAKRN
jgi:hypothetical protein